MPIDTQCPHCRKAYRVKDEMAGKRLTCANPDCRKVFTAEGRALAGGPQSPAGGLAPAPSPASTAVAPPPGGGTPAPMPKLPTRPTVGDPTPLPQKKLPASSLPKKVPVAQKAPPRAAADAEAIASKALSDEIPLDGGPGDSKTIEMMCEDCDHKWSVGWDKQGKNVVCPECRHHMKVPVIKKEDWRTQNKPSLAKIDDVLDDVAMGDKKTWVGDDALEKAGVIDEDVEERPRWHRVAWLATAVAVVAGIWLAVSSVRQTRTVTTQEFSISTALKELESHPDALPKPEAPLYQAALHHAAAEYAVRRGDQDKIGTAVSYFRVARAALAKAAPSDERDALFAELLVAQVTLGGDDEQMRERTRLGWRQEVAKGPRPQVKDVASNVQKELQDTLLQMNKEDAKVKADVRHAAVRRVARELIRRKQHTVVTQILAIGFTGRGELSEAASQLCLEVLRETKDADAVLKMAQEFGLPTDKDSAVSAEPLQKVLNRPEFKTVSKPAAEPSKNANAAVSDRSRQAYVTLYLAQNNPAEAVTLAKRPGSLDSRLSMLSLVAETAADPAPAIQAAVDVLAEPRPKTGPPVQPPGQALARMVQVAARSGQHDKVEPLVAAVPDAGLKEWAKAEALRIRLQTAADRKPAEESAAPIPDHQKDFKLGHAWARLAVARHNAAVTGGGKPDAYDGWGAFKPFGLAGLALGQQDRTTPR